MTLRDLDALHSWHADWSGLRVAVLGLGVTGFAVADTLAELEARPLVLRGRPDPDREQILEVLGVPVVAHDDDTVPTELVTFDPDLVIASPGYRLDHPLLAWAGEREIPIWGDIELAWRVRDKVAAAEWILVTGTNGKTTTTQLVEHLLLAGGRRAMAAGNIGVPVLDAIRLPDGLDTIVVELSSFQLHRLPLTGPGALAPLASVCLNIADDHLDYHGGRAGYEAVKGRVYNNTRVACVYNRDDAVTRRLVEEADVLEGCRAIGFGLDTPGPSDLGIVEGIVVDRAFLDERFTQALEITTVEELAAARLDSPHLLADVVAATALARAADVSPAAIRSALATFRRDAHRTQLVADVDGVQWVNDSKATNPHAANAALTGTRSAVWIVGGLLKGARIDDVVRAHAHHLRAAVLIGAERGEVLAAFARHAPGVAVFEVTAGDTDRVMPQAVALAAAAAQPGDTVLLAPAAASMDQFVSYADRGTRFAQAVALHLGGEADGTTLDSHPHPA